MMCRSLRSGWKIRPVAALATHALGGRLYQYLVDNVDQLLNSEGFQEMGVTAVLQPLGMTMIARHQDWPAALLACDLRQRKAVLVSRLGNFDNSYIVIVVVQSLSHLGSGLDPKETEAFLLEHVAEQIP